MNILSKLPIRGQMYLIAVLTMCVFAVILLFTYSGSASILAKNNEVNTNDIFSQMEQTILSNYDVVKWLTYNIAYNKSIQDYLLEDDMLTKLQTYPTIKNLFSKLIHGKAGDIGFRGHRNRRKIRAKMPIGQGMWPAIWMMPDDLEKYGGWPSCGEIDIMEYLGHEPQKVHGTLHMGNPHYYIGGDTLLANGTFADDFHLFVLEWTPTAMRWYVDDELYYSITDWYTLDSENNEKAPFPAPFNRPFFMQLNLAVGGNWPGYPDASTVFPQTFKIDYVRVYQPADGNYETEDRG